MSTIIENEQPIAVLVNGSETVRDPSLEKAEVVNQETNKDAMLAKPISAFAGMTSGQVIRKFWRLYLIGYAVSIAGIYMGYTLTLPGSIIANQGFINALGTQNGQGAQAINALYVGIWNGTFFGAQVLMQGLSTITGNKFGIRFNMWILTVLIIFAIVLEIRSKDWKLYLVAKIVAGFASGFVGTSITTFISEITMPQMRGSHLSAFAFFFALGQVFCAIGLEILQNTAPLQFRRAFYSEFAVVGVWLMVLVWLPESPVWLYKKGKHDKAKRALLRLVGKHPDYDIEREYAVIGYEVEESLKLTEKSSKLTWLACLKGTNLRRTLISTIPLSMQNFVGGPLMLNGAYFFSMVGIGNPFQGNTILFCVLLICTAISFYLVERVGRRPLLLGGGVVMAITTIIVGICGTIGINSKTGPALVAMCCIWVVAYAFSCGPIGWLSIVELSTPMLRVQTAGFACILQSLNGVIFNYTVPLMLSNQYAGWGAKTGYFFGGLSVLSTAVVYFTMPETKGRTYVELDELFEQRLPARKFKSAKTSSQAQIESGGLESARQV